MVGGVLAEIGITAQKRAEEALREEHRRKDEFLAILSHELRNPLAPIRNSVYLLRQTGASDEQSRRARSVIERQVSHLTRIVDDLLDVTRIARAKIELRRDRFDLRDLVRRTGEGHRSLMEDRSIHFRVEVPDERLWADGDPTPARAGDRKPPRERRQIHRPRGNVVLSARANGGAAEVSVADDGAGIDEHLLPRVFARFVQAERTLARSSGGLDSGSRS